MLFTSNHANFPRTLVFFCNQSSHSIDEASSTETPHQSNKHLICLFRIYNAMIIVKFSFPISYHVHESINLY